VEQREDFVVVVVVRMVCALDQIKRKLQTGGRRLRIWRGRGVIDSGRQQKIGQSTGIHLGQGLVGRRMDESRCQ
jgi:hypothetical protein